MGSSRSGGATAGGAAARSGRRALLTALGASLVAGLAAACEPVPALRRPRQHAPTPPTTPSPTTPPPQPDPDAGVLARVAAQEQQLAAQAAATGRRYRRLRQRVEPVLDHHRRHLAAVSALLVVAREGPLPTPLPTASPTATGSASTPRETPSGPAHGSAAPTASGPAGSSRADRPADGPRSAATDPGSAASGSGSPDPTGPATGATGSADAALAALVAAERQARRRRTQELAAVRSGELARLLASIAACEALHPALLRGSAHPTPAGATAPGRGGPSRPGDGDLPALQASLAGVHAALWGYGVVGARLATVDQAGAARAEADLETYRALRDRLRELVRAAGAEPVAAAAGYRLPFPVRSASAARRLAVHLETRSAALVADLVGAADRQHGLRGFGADLLVGCAARATAWGWRPVAFPGLPERG